MVIDGARILITGGSLGIGKVTAKVLVDAGAKVGITGRDRRRLDSAAEETGGLPIVADVSQPGDIKRTYERFVDEFGGIDCLINNAGIARRRLVEDIRFEDFEDVFRVNVFGAALMAANAVRYFKSQGYGHIVNVGSTAAVKGYQGGSVYGASKFALRGMTMCWQNELRKHNIRVFLINPSEVATAIGSKDRVERAAPPNKLSSLEIAHSIKAVLEMDDRGFIPELEVWATNPW
ncbi:MAG: SDR family oxidoreductase [Candidatus Latescibacterota bacterium]|nr:MAG: SDR family oxidoreductase [Candidatus Latescibacterota bacterium]